MILNTYTTSGDRFIGTARVGLAIKFEESSSLAVDETMKTETADAEVSRVIAQSTIDARLPDMRRIRHHDDSRGTHRGLDRYDRGSLN
jgi:hypothetical protein